MHFGPRLGMERCGKRKVSNSGAESWTGIGVVAGFGAVVLIMQWPYERNGDGTWGNELLQILLPIRRTKSPKASFSGGLSFGSTVL